MRVSTFYHGEIIILDMNLIVLSWPLRLRDLILNQGDLHVDKHRHLMNTIHQLELLGHSPGPLLCSSTIPQSNLKPRPFIHK